MQEPIGIEELKKVATFLSNDHKANRLIGANILHALAVIPKAVLDCVQDVGYKNMLGINIIEDEDYEILFNLGCVCNEGHNTVVDHIYKIKKLHTFTAVCDSIKIPDSFKSLEDLKVFSLSVNTNTGNEEAYFDILSSFEKLEHLNLDLNKLNYIPKSIEKLKELRYLNISRNHLTELPEELLGLKKLEELKLTGCDFKTFPFLIYQLNSLKKLTISKRYLFEEEDKLKNLFGENLKILN